MREHKINNWFRQNILLILGSLFVFVGIYIFFAKIIRVIPFDGDDWFYLYETRFPVIAPGSWNPSRIFQEILHPFIGFLAGIFIYPFTNDYVIAVSIMVSLTLAVFMVFLFCQLYFLAFEYSSSKSISFFMSGLIIIVYFAIFKSNRSDVEYSTYLLDTLNICCLFAYAIPNLLNSCLIIRIFRWILSGNLLIYSPVPQKVNCPTHTNSYYVKLGLWALLFYLAIFSMESSAALLTSCAFVILVHIVMITLKQQKFQKGKKLNTHKIIWANGKLYITICLSYMLSLGVMLTGGRAKWDNGNTFHASIFSSEFAARIYWAAKSLISLCLEVNIVVLVMMIGIFTTTLVVYYLNRKEDKNHLLIMKMKFCIVAAMFYTFFIIMVFAKAAPNQAGRVDSAYGLFFLIILCCFLGVLYILSKYKQLSVLFPFALIVLFAITSNTSSSFIGQNRYSAYGEDQTYLSYVNRKALMDDLIAQVINADEEGLESMTLYVPMFDSADNWPIPTYRTDFAMILYRRGVISRNIAITIEPVKGYIIQ